ncbi:MAG TPA: hypothetical protein VFX70_17785, partial [Mycobacteriales bacterium]|nr:hypothetical protein [Mycobacteriales bacterium]
RVKVELGKRKGKLVVEFASMDDLRRIVGLMSPGARARVEQVEADGAAESE